LYFGGFRIVADVQRRCLDSLDAARLEAELPNRLRQLSAKPYLAGLDLTLLDTQSGNSSAVQINCRWDRSRSFGVLPPVLSLVFLTHTTHACFFALHSKRHGKLSMR
jgi:hypothetical protein